MLKIVVLVSSFCFGVGLNMYYLDYIYPLFNASYLHSQHPLSFELISALNSCKLTVESYNTSDGKRVSLLIKELDSLIVEQEVKQFLGKAHCILERQQILNPKTGQFEVKITAIFNQKDQNTTCLSIITTDGVTITVITAPTLWHVQEFQYYLVSD